MKLYEMTGHYAALQRAAEDGEDCSEALAALIDALEVKAERIAALLRNFDADAEACAAEEKRLAARRKARENASERVREYLRGCMVEAGIERLKSAAFTAYLTEHASVVVDDIERVPAEYKRTKTEVSVDKKAVQAAYKQNGECVDGTHVAINKTLTVR